jgi:hypothetical protein
MQFGPEVGPTSALYSCFATGMHGPTCIFWADLTAFSLQYSADEPLDECIKEMLHMAHAGGLQEYHKHVADPPPPPSPTRGTLAHGLELDPPRNTTGRTQGRGRRAQVTYLPWVILGVLGGGAVAYTGWTWCAPTLNISDDARQALGATHSIP